ncbi:MAG TPA: DegQ family serine endoprotease [Syntrophorhabdales bacterium]|nr:DegQ family serine endoprotease [Syntrophorhabdales bacterium]
MNSSRHLPLSLCCIALVCLLVCAGVFAQTKTRAQDIAVFPPSLADLVDMVKPGVVNISATATVKVPGNPFSHFFGPDDQGPLGDFFRRHWNEVPDRELKRRSLGSGFIIDKEGYIITNNHVVERADEITVKVNGKEYKARIVGRDPKTDLALIKISTPVKDLQPLSLGDSERMRVGDWVIAIGNPFGLEETVTKGIISATGRVIGAGPYDNFLQTDAPINPGNSGGPLLNLKGEVIGINTAIVASGQGIGFAIPINTAKLITTQLREKGAVTRGWLGLTLQNMTPDIAQALGLKESGGVLVADVLPGGPAEAAGVQKGDVIVRFNGKEVKTTGDLSRLVAETPINNTVTVRALRKGVQQDIAIKITEAPRETTAPTARTQTGADLGMQVDAILEKYQRQFQLRDRTGVVVVSVAPGSAAEKAGIQAGDIIKELNRFSVRNLSEYRTLVRQVKSGASLLVLVKRAGSTFYVAMTAP